MTPPLMQVLQCGRISLKHIIIKYALVISYSKAINSFVEGKAAPHFN